MQNLKVPTDCRSSNEYKLCVLGQGAVGKTSLIIQFVQGIFHERYDPTIEDLYRKTGEIDGKEYTVEILDTAGTETFTAMRDLYIRNGQGFALVYSILSEGTFNELQQIYQQIRNIKKDQPALILVGNKLDLADEQRMVSREKGQALADQWMCPFYETSAKNSIHVDQIFFDLIRQINHQTPRIRKASRQEDMPLPILAPFRTSLFCPCFARHKSSKQIKSISKSNKF